ncbi:hypothetical protein RQ699_20030, partial [Acinetobacter baumannii]
MSCMLTLEEIEIKRQELEADLANGYITATLDATAADPVTGQIVIHAEAVDAQGNVDVADADVTLTIDTTPQDLITAITVP